MILAVVWVTGATPHRRPRRRRGGVGRRAVGWARADDAREPRGRRSPTRPSSAGPAGSTGSSPRPTPTPAAELDFTTRSSAWSSPSSRAQTTDRRVNAAQPGAVRRLPDPEAMAAAPREHLEQLLGPLGFFRPRPTRCSSSARRSSSATTAQVPPKLDELVTLPGVGRKTANVVLGNAFDKPGITVDTHFGRLVRRFGWTEETDPVKVEHAIGALFPKRDWTMLSHHLIWHGRRRCHAKKPACGACPVARLCPSFGAGPTDPIEAEKLVTTRGRREGWPGRGAAGARWSSPARAGAPDSVDVRPPDVDVDTPALREVKARIGMDDCAPGDGEPVEGGLPERDPAVPRRRPRRRALLAARPDGDQPLGGQLRPVPHGDAGAGAVPPAVRRPGCRSSASTSTTRSPTPRCSLVRGDRA